MSVSAAERSFAEIATDLALLDAATLAELAASAAQRGVSPELLALERGVLTAPELDMVQTLKRPRDAVPGYELLAPLGYGGMGVVYRARQIALARPVALKTVLMEHLGDQKALARFEQEAQTLARLAHPHIVAAIDFGRHQGRLFFAMELVEGENVEQFVSRRGPLDAYTACGLLRQAAGALAHAARHGVIHRDVKPANMLLVERPAGIALPAGVSMLKVADFGLALLTEATSAARLTTEHMAVGSPHYMSPEQLSGEPLDGRADMYALGASLYHMLTGSPPLAEKSLAQIITAKLHTGLPPIAPRRPDLPPEVLELVARLTARAPDGRYRDYDELLAALDALPLAAPSSVATQQVPLPIPKSPTWALPEATTPLIDQAATATTVLPSAPPPPSDTATRKDIDDRAAVPPAGFDRRWLLAAGAGLVLVAVPLGWHFLGSRPAPPPRTLVPVGPIRPLFAGKTLGGWNGEQRGLWVPEDKDKDGFKLSGSKGYKYRALPSGRDYRVELSVSRDAAAISGVAFAGRSDGTCLLVRLAAESASVRRVKASDPNSTPLAEFSSAPLAASGEDYLVQLERQHDTWWVLVDEQLVATLLDPTPADPPLLGLTVAQGTAYFGDITWQQLGPP